MFVVVLLFELYVFITLRARHDHIKIAPCGIINVLLLFFKFELHAGEGLGALIQT